MSAWGVQLLRRLARRRPLILFDNPGQGLSTERVTDAGPVTVDHMEKASTGACPLPAKDGAALRAVPPAGLPASRCWHVAARAPSPLLTTDSSALLQHPPCLQALVGLLEALSIPRAHVAGLSLGACTVLQAAALHPERIRRAVAMAGTSPDGRAHLGAPAVMARLLNTSNTPLDLVPLFFNLSTPSGRLGACGFLAGARAMPEDLPIRGE